jgi:hypothetical protein
LFASAALGRQVAALLDTDTPLSGVTTGTIRTELRTLAAISKVGNGNLNLEAGDLALTAGWGHYGNDEAVMPGKGKVVERDYAPSELAAIESSAKALVFG